VGRESGSIDSVGELVDVFRLVPVQYLGTAILKPLRNLGADVDTDTEEAVALVETLLDFPRYPIAVGRLIADEHDGHRRARHLVSYFLANVVLVCGVDWIQEMPADEFDVDVLGVGHEIEALRLHLIGVLVANEHAPRHGAILPRSRY